MDFTFNNNGVVEWKGGRLWRKREWMMRRTINAEWEWGLKVMKCRFILAVHISFTTCQDSHNIKLRWNHNGKSWKATAKFSHSSSSSFISKISLLWQQKFDFKFSSFSFCYSFRSWRNSSVVASPNISVPDNWDVKVEDKNSSKEAERMWLWRDIMKK